MTVDQSRPGPAGEDRAASGLGRVLGRLRRAGPGRPSGPRSELHIYRGGHLELGVNSERLASAVEAFLNADLTPRGSQQ